MDGAWTDLLHLGAIRTRGRDNFWEKEVVNYVNILANQVKEELRIARVFSINSKLKGRCSQKWEV